MRPRRSSMRLVAVGVLVMGVLGGAFAAGRSTVTRVRSPDPLGLEHGIAIGAVDTPAGALVAADNYVATGIGASLDAEELAQFANAVVAPAAREQFIADNQRRAQPQGLPRGARVLATVVAHRLDSYSAPSAVVSTWALATGWDALAPTQYSALVQLSLRWSGDRWQISAVRESLPGPVPGRVAGTRQARSAGAWDRALTGMAAPYYGDG